MTSPVPVAAESAGSSPVGTLASISLDCSDPRALADFYGRLLGLTTVYERPDGSVIAMSNGAICLTMMLTPDHVAPTWPEPGQLQQMHLDVSVDDLHTAAARAIELGAREPAVQPGPDIWRVLIDPAGHPFCLTTVNISS